jgi:hypothetical protein
MSDPRFEGRPVPVPPRADDDGSADPALAAALARWQDEGRPRPARLVHEALRQARLLVPVVAVLEEGEVGALGLRSDKSSHMASVVIERPDGSRGLPAFTSTQAMAEWNPQARPAPVEGPRAGQAALAEGCEALLVDLAGPVSHVVAGPGLWALAQDREWVEPHRDAMLGAHLSQVLADLGAVRVRLAEPTDPAPGGPELVIEVDAPGVDLREFVQEATARLREDLELRTRLEGGFALAVRG